MSTSKSFVTQHFYEQIDRHFCWEAGNLQFAVYQGLPGLDILINEFRVPVESEQ